jgi:hypothetical protein
MSFSRGKALWLLRNPPMKLNMYPTFKWSKLPEHIKDQLRDYCIGQDLHPHRDCYIDYNIADKEFATPNSVTEYFYSLGAKPEHTLVLIQLDI